LVILSLLPLIVIAIAFGLLATFQPGTPRPEMAVGILFGVTVAIVIAVCAIIYISVLLTFTPLLIIDKGYRLWPAMQLSRRMVSRRWWMTLWFLFVSGVVYTAGFFLCVVGLLASAPVYFGMKAVLYDDNFGDLARPS
jgi:hypothetical protein